MSINKPCEFAGNFQVRNVLYMMTYPIRNGTVTKLIALNFRYSHLPCPRYVSAGSVSGIMINTTACT